MAFEVNITAPSDKIDKKVALEAATQENLEIQREIDYATGQNVARSQSNTDLGLNPGDPGYLEPLTVPVLYPVTTVAEIGIVYGIILTRRVEQWHQKIKAAYVLREAEAVEALRQSFDWEDPVAVQGLIDYYEAHQIT